MTSSSSLSAKQQGWSQKVAGRVLKGFHRHVGRWIWRWFAQDKSEDQPKWTKQASWPIGQKKPKKETKPATNTDASLDQQESCATRTL